ncbi:MAG: RsmE family RNA methyltransferase [Caldilinea sp.]
MAAETWPARHRFWVETPLGVGAEPRLDALAHQLGSVLRLKPGDAIVLVNGDGCEYLALLTEVGARRAAAHVFDLRPTNADPRIELTLYMATLKQDKFEWVLQKATELGVTCITPVVSQRSVVRPATALAGKRTRWLAIVREATEQCGRTRPPLLTDAVDAHDVRLPAGVHGFLAWETADASAPSLGAAVVAVADSIAAGQPLALLVGPEGGLAVDEVQRLTAGGWQMVSLGRRILRAETAALAAVAIVMERCGELA